MSVYGAGANWKSLKQKVMLGGKQISKIYVGNTLVYPESESGTGPEPEEPDFFKYAIWTELSEPISATIDYASFSGYERVEITVPITRFGKYVFCENAKDLERITRVAFYVIKGPSYKGSIKRCSASAYVGVTANPRNSVRVCTFAANEDTIVLAHNVGNNGKKPMSRTLKVSDGKKYLYEDVDSPLFSFREKEIDTYLLMNDVYVSDPSIVEAFCSEDSYTYHDAISFVTDGEYDN